MLYPLSYEGRARNETSLRPRDARGSLPDEATRRVVGWVGIPSRSLEEGLPSPRSDGYGQPMEQAEVVAFPTRGEVFVDQRGESRALRLAWHTEADVVVLSLWQGDRCSGSFRLAVTDVPRFVQALVDGLGAAAMLPAAQTARLGLQRMSS